MENNINSSVPPSNPEDSLPCPWCMIVGTSYCKCQGRNEFDENCREQLRLSFQDFPVNLPVVLPDVTTGYGIPPHSTFPFTDDFFKQYKDHKKKKGYPFKYVYVKEVRSRYINKFQSHVKDYKIFFKKDLPTALPDNDLVTLALTEMVEFAKSHTGYKLGDQINVVVDNPEFNQPISTGYASLDIVEKLKEKICQIITSDESVALHKCVFQIHVVNMLKGAARGGRILNLAKDRRTKQSILLINNKDNLCCPRAIVTGLSYHSNVILGEQLSTNDIIYLQKGRGIQRRLALKLCGLIEEYDKEGFTLENIKSCEIALDTQIKVVCAENFNAVVYNGRVEKDIKIYLYKQGNHYDLITKMQGFYSSVYFCHQCNTPYNNLEPFHRCKGKTYCPLCHQKSHDPQTHDEVYCVNCDRGCYNKECLQKHTMTVCKLEYKCTGCDKIVKRKDQNNHRCGWAKCENCKEVVFEVTHLCYMQQRKPKGGRCHTCKVCNPTAGVVSQENTKCTYTEKYIFFDYEAQQETGIHIPNLIVAHDFHGNKSIFKTNNEFCEWLIDKKKHKGYTAIAHYAKGYDSQFILQYLLANTIKPEAIYSGTKLMSLLVKTAGLNLTIIDSYNFVGSSLSTFPKTFGLQELNKGYFPHLFNTKENENYIGPIPDKKYYGYNTMKSDVCNEFVKWHDARVAEGYIFDMSKEIQAYCDSDVDILRRGMLEFRKTFLEIGNIDPLQYMTTPAVCMALFRSKYIKHKTIAICPDSPIDQFSKQSIMWLRSLNNPNIKHALNGGEVELCGAKVDGYDEQTMTVYQYHGCYWHGCPNCYKSDTKNPNNKNTMRDLYAKTKARTLKLRCNGYTVVELWECEWVQSNKYKQMHGGGVADDVIEPLNPRNAFFGGRTEVFKLKCQLNGHTMGNEGSSGHRPAIRYIDVCSLYPSVMYYGYYPVGHPVAKIKSPKEYNPEWFGVVKCRVLPPTSLYIPVLPLKVKMEKAEKLVFPLCIRCAETRQQTRCKHSVKERQFMGTWATVEIKKAIEMGYKILEIYEVWHFEKNCDLWKGYISDFMKIKLETSPHNYESNEAYIKENKEKMGIKLDLSNIAPNPGKRAVSKMCLNSLWGKFGQRKDLPGTEFITEPDRFYEVLLDDRYEKVDSIFVTDQMVQVNYKYKTQYIRETFNTNIFVAIFTTANARMLLYNQLSALNKAVLYCDTDSIVYLDDGENTVKTGDMLGEWTDELGSDTHIQKWLATGPKSYHYETNKGKTTTKVKGFTLHHKNALKINGEAMEKLIDGSIPNIMVTDHQITRDIVSKQLVNKTLTKTFNFGFDKRMIKENYDTLPYGYVE